MTAAFPLAVSQHELPGPKPHPILGNIPDLRHSPNVFETWTRLNMQYGDVVYLRVGPLKMFVVRNPDIIQHVLQKNNRNYWKGRQLKVIEPLVGKGLLTSEGDFWRRQRRLAQPAFHRRQIAALAQTMIDSADHMLDRWESLAASGQRFDAAAAMMRLTLDIVSRTLFSSALTRRELDRVAETFTPVLEETNRRSQRIFHFWDRLPTRRNRAYRRGIASLEQTVYDIIARRRASGEEKDDLLGMLMAARDEQTNQFMDDKQLRDEAMTIFLAGHETTAVTLSWALALLSRHPDVREKLFHEVDTVLQGRKPTPESAQQLAYTRMVIDETMRLYPPAVAVVREAYAGDVLGDFPIEGGAQVVINIHGVHRHPDFWENPEGFQPERFTPQAQKNRHKYAYLPFSAGPRVCIGNHFALMEATLILAMIAQRYQVDLVPPYTLEPRMTLTLRPAKGVPVVLRRR